MKHGKNKYDKRKKKLCTVKKMTLGKKYLINGKKDDK